MAATKSPLMRLGHIRDEIANLLLLFAGVDYPAFASSYAMVRTTVRYPEIEWHAIRSIGNILRHEYERVETAMLWRVVTESLPQLAPVIDRMIRDLKK
ncbi:MAG TPA: HepT-like ribonuclease domain-containing protein [Xanthobacteraceae bacterium]|nr:HepT-like ribonuclease domain-containing protein [Xanthobacteraceae bacterium]